MDPCFTLSLIDPGAPQIVLKSRTDQQQHFNEFNCSPPPPILHGCLLWIFMNFMHGCLWISIDILDCLFGKGRDLCHVMSHRRPPPPPHMKTVMSMNEKSRTFGSRFVCLFSTNEDDKQTMKSAWRILRLPLARALSFHFDIQPDHRLQSQT